jgi:hypothetical protein
LVAKLATYPKINKLFSSESTNKVKTAQIAAAKAEPHTFAGDRIPDLFSAIPSASLRSIPTRVTAEPQRK